MCTPRTSLLSRCCSSTSSSSCSTSRRATSCRSIADERILPNGTAYQTDVGMTGAYDSVIGFRPDEALHRFLMNTPRKLEVAKRDIRLSGALVEIDEETGRAVRITRVREDLGE